MDTYESVVTGGISTDTQSNVSQLSVEMFFKC